jgi:hypothetical protein
MEYRNSGLFDVLMFGINVIENLDNEGDGSFLVRFRVTLFEQE